MSQATETMWRRLGFFALGSMAFVACARGTSDDPSDAGANAVPVEAGPAQDSPPPDPIRNEDASTADGDVDDSSAATDSASLDAALPAPLEGYFVGANGNMMFKAVGAEIWGAYGHDEGTVRGVVVGDRFKGWWCEVPDRLPPANAGEVEFILKAGDGSATPSTLDGRWRYGGAQQNNAFDEAWDLTRSSAAPPQPLVDRFLNPALFCPKP